MILRGASSNLLAFPKSSSREIAGVANASSHLSPDTVDSTKTKPPRGDAEHTSSSVHATADAGPAELEGYDKLAGPSRATSLKGAADGEQVDNSYSGTNQMLERLELRSGSEGSSGKKRLREREHIYAQAHRKQVIEDRKLLREELQKELYKTKRKSGFTSGYADFKSLLEYQALLQNLGKSGRYLSSQSLVDLRAKTSQGLRVRRHSVSDEDDTAFLQRALANAKATLNTPKPPAPFTPTLEQRRRVNRLKDEELDARFRPKLPSSLPPEDEAKVAALLHKQGVVSRISKEQVTDQDMIRLRPRQWLNDEIINFYGALVSARSEGCKENPGNGGTNGRGKPLKVHYFSTFFWSKLRKEGYDRGRLAKWTKKFDLFSKDTILIPVNHNNAHWTCAAINFRRKRIESYDSMGMAKDEVFKHLRIYLDAEHRNKKKKPFDFTGWENYAPDWTPQQENGFDCGVFTCQFLEALSRGEESFIFSQKDMPYLRRRMVWEIGHASLRDD
jgi:sentrin-specific protease 1